METKQQLRKRVVAVRDGIAPADRAEKAKKVIERILTHPAYKNAKTIFAYKAFGSELDLAGLFEHVQVQGKTFAYPVCDGRGRMCAASVDGNHWQTDRYGILEPALAYARIVAPGEIDLVLAPGAAFDRYGCRLGYGAGYYDRFLPLCGGAYRLGVAFEEQMLEAVETCAHDCTMHAVVTDAAVYESAACG